MVNLLVRLELLLLDWFFNEEDDAVWTSFLSGAVDVLEISKGIVDDHHVDILQEGRGRSVHEQWMSWLS